MPESDSDVTELLHAWSGGDRGALDKLTPLVLDELHRLARAHFAREPEAHTLQPTALVSELFARLLKRRNVQWENRAQFFKAATDLMRCILVDHARRHRTAKRGGGVQRVPVEEVELPIEMPGVDVIALYEALDELKREDPVGRELVELKFFLGLTLAEIADVLGISVATVKLKWTAARARLYRRLKEG
jgi:RNA polymerase sigma factor (TIGR02999 family)